MREEESLSEFDQDLSLIVSEIDRLNRTVSQLLAFSRPSHAESRPVRLSDLISASVTIAGAEAKERGVDLRIESITDVVLTGTQGGALRDALSNVVLNAVQATEAGEEVVIRAVLQTSGRESEIRTGQSVAEILAITISDTGPGIPADSQQRVFEPFYSTKSRGTGLGLAIVQRRVVEIGGSVELVSPVANGRGTQFRLIVPLSAVESGMEQGN